MIVPITFFMKLYFEEELDDLLVLLRYGEIYENGYLELRLIRLESGRKLELLVQGNN